MANSIEASNAAKITAAKIVEILQGNDIYIWTNEKNIGLREYKRRQNTVDMLQGVRNALEDGN